MRIRPNRVKEKLAAGEAAYMVVLHDPNSIDMFGPNGFDGVWLDSEHGPNEYSDMGNLTRACDLWGMTSLLRVNRNERSLIYRALDQGVQGVVVPHVKTREEAENIVAGGKYAPIGERGMYPARQSYGVEDFLSVANDQTLLVAMIEDDEAVQNLDEILEVDHIDVFLLGPHDLASSLGHIGNPGHPEVQLKIDDAVARIQQRDRVAGILTDNEGVAKYSAAGVRFLFTSTAPWLREGAREFINRAEAAKK